MASSTKFKQNFRIAFAIVTVLFLVVITLLIGKPMIDFLKDPEGFQNWVKDKGIWGVLSFMGLNFLQVILAVIPGGAFEIGAGYAFGVLKGSILCDISMTAGSMVTFLFVKKFGMRFVELFVSHEKIESIRFLKTSTKSKTILFFVFLLPGTPKDLLSYAVGLTDLSFGAWFFINIVGRFPAIYLSAMSGSALGGKRYFFAGIMVAVIVLLYILGTIFYRLSNRPKQNGDDEES